jgi:hypothetical protein
VPTSRDTPPPPPPKDQRRRQCPRCPEYTDSLRWNNTTILGPMTDLSALHEGRLLEGPWQDVWACWWCGYAEFIERPAE